MSGPEALKLGCTEEDRLTVISVLMWKSGLAGLLAQTYNGVGAPSKSFSVIYEEEVKSHKSSITGSKRRPTKLVESK